MNTEKEINPEASNPIQIIGNNVVRLNKSGNVAEIIGTIKDKQEDK